MEHWFYYYILTTASLSGGWVPETSRSFYYWQPAPRWRLLPWLANPGNSALSPHTGKGNRHPSHWIDSRKRGEIGRVKLPGWRAATPHNATRTQSKYMQKPLQWRAHGIPAHADMQKVLTPREHWCSLLLTPIKSAFNCIKCYTSPSNSLLPWIAYVTPQINRNLNYKQQALKIGSQDCMWLLI